MENFKKILFINLNWEVKYIEIHQGVLIKYGVSLETALKLLANEKFDLIITEPMNMAVLTSQESTEERVEDILQVLNTLPPNRKVGFSDPCKG